MLWLVTQLPNGIDTSVPHAARVYDYWLGGKDNFAADRRAAEAGYKAFPGVVQAAHANRAFLGRVVRYLAAEMGIRQFLDVGSGLPAASNTHEIAQEKAPESRVVYVDIDPVVVLHARVLLRSAPEGKTDFLQADARDPAAILDQAAASLDFDQPVAVLLLGVLHDYPDDAQVAAITRAFAGAIAPGSFLAVSHLAGDLQPETVLRFALTMGDQGLPPGALRSRDQVAALFAGLDLVDPGVVPVSRWHPDTDLEASALIPVWGAVARKPGGEPAAGGR
jgi:O-methyltransferase involved in polyketide biosynthesis